MAEGVETTEADGDAERFDRLAGAAASRAARGSTPEEAELRSVLAAAEAWAAYPKATADAVAGLS